MTDILVGSALLTAIVLVLTLLVRGAHGALSPHGPAVVTVNKATPLESRLGQSLLTALTENGVLIPSACAGNGTCGLCRVKLTDGGDEPLPTETARIARADLRNGMRLACQVRLKRDVAVEVPEDLIGATTYEVEVTAARFLTPLIREIVFQLPEGYRPPIEAGAFLQVTAPAIGLNYSTLEVPSAYADTWATIRQLSVKSDVAETRAYSISNRPEDTDAGRIVLNVRLALPPPAVAGAKPGVVSSYLFMVKPGDQVAASGPFGSFRAQDTQAEMVFIGGGVGMAPLRAVILDQLQLKRTDRKISFWYGARSLRELYYVEELKALAKKHPNFDLTIALSDPDPADDWDGPTGFIHSVVWRDCLETHPAPEGCEYYLCGPRLMIQAVMAMLDDAGVEKSQIFNDDFGI